MTMVATLTQCRDCAALAVSIPEAGVAARQVGGTGEIKCLHTMELQDRIPVNATIHLALSTLIRSGDLSDEDKAMAHVIQERMGVHDALRCAGILPWILRRDYDVSSYGLAVARILAANMAKISTNPTDAMYWRAAASVMRRKLP